MKTNTTGYAKRFSLIFAVIIPTLCQAQNKTDEALIQSIIQEEVTGWNSGNAKMFSNHFAKDGTFTNIRGQFFTGYQVFLEKHEDIFKTIFKGTKLEDTMVSLRFVKADVAIVEVICVVSGFATPPPGLKLDADSKLVTRLLQVMVKDGADFKIEAFHNVDVKPAPPTPEKK